MIINNIVTAVSVCLALIFTSCIQHTREDQPASEYFTSGITNQGNNKQKPYVTAGSRSYIIGNQDGNFPDMGGHVAGEMGGLWVHPLKVMDGFWVKITNTTSGETAWLREADEFINYPHGNRLVYSSGPGQVAISRFQFCPDEREGIVIEYTLENLSGDTKNLELDFAVKTDLSPVWFSKEIGVYDYPDSVEWDEQQGVFNAKDSLHPWYAVWGASVPATKHSFGKDVEVPETTTGGGVKAVTTHTVTLTPGKSASIIFFVAGSNRQKESALSVYLDLQKNYASLLETKKAQYQALLEQAKITIPDKALQQVYDWVKINTAWLVRTVPEIGTGLTAGYMEYPWWFGCDNTYALQAVLATGDMELAKNTLRLLLRKSMEVNGNGRIVHEISTNGAVSNKGNTQETAHFIMCVARVYEYTGDMDFVREMYSYITQGINWLLTDMDRNKNMFPEGYGITEILGLNAELIDVSVYTQQALESAALLAAAMSDAAGQAHYNRLAGILKDKINTDFWDEANSSYCDFYGTAKEAASTCEGALEQLRRDNKADSIALETRAYYRKLKDSIARMPAHSRGWLTNKNWVINTPMETGIAPREKALRALNIIREENCGPYGPYLRAAVDRRHMMTISTGVQAVAECRYGRIDEALWYVNKIVETFGRTLPGSISEMMPDYGCFTQAWTNYGVVVPLLRYIFGVVPDAQHKQIVIRPQFPESWGNAGISQLPVGDNALSFSRERSGNEVKYIFTHQKKEWKVVFDPAHEPGTKYYLNGKELPGKPALIPLDQEKNELIIKN